MTLSATNTSKTYRKVTLNILLDVPGEDAWDHAKDIGIQVADLLEGEAAVEVDVEDVVVIVPLEVRFT